MAIVGVVVVVSGCGAEPGTPTPQPTSSSALTQTAASSKPPPSRPREIRMDGRDPCALLTQEQLTVLKFDRPGRVGTSEFYEAPSCSWTVSGQSIQVIPVIKEGIEAWTSGKRRGQPAEIAPVMGFPTVTVTLPTDNDQCDVLVDVADGQLLSATFSVSPSFKDRFPMPCDGARLVAEAVMENLTK